MSCLCPISIPDKVAIAYGVKGASIVVPCGHCTECARDRRNDWFVRLWSTYQRFKQAGLPAWFVTVTIDPKLWPNMTLTSEGIGDRISPFMRSWCERFRYLNGGVMPLRFLCSEFGSSGREYIDHNGVQRVTTGALHFHGVIFGYLPIKKLVAGFEKSHGHVDFDLVRGPQSIRYVVKYATKDYSITDYKLRARTFASPGIGDSTYFFGDNAPTSMVLINGFHYRTPRYFLEKQWCHVYGRENFYDADGRSFFVRRNFECRKRDYNRINSLLSTLQHVDSVLKSYSLHKLLKTFSCPATLDVVTSLCDLGITGPSHPLLRSVQRSKLYRDYVDMLEGDRSFINRKPYCSISQFFTYERTQAVVPLSLDFSS